MCQPFPTAQASRLPQTPALSELHIQDAFWDRYIDLVPRQILPYQWQALNDQLPATPPSHSVRNFRIAAGLEQADFDGFVFQDSDSYKWLEAVAYSLATHPDPGLEAQADSLIELLEQAQCEDGYLNTYFQIKAPDQRWHNLCDCHELYCAGHLIEAAVAYSQCTGKDRLLGIACRFADLIAVVFGPGDQQLHGYPGHEEIELALIRLWQHTATPRYFNLAAYFINQRGQKPNYFERERSSADFYELYPGSRQNRPDLSYHQADQPVRQQTRAQGHAVRAVYLYCAMADAAAAADDQELMAACVRLWEDIAWRQLYLTGSIGQSGWLERFTTDYDLSNDANYSETCAAIGLALFSLRLGRNQREGRYHDVAELALFNTVLAGIQQDGTRFFYVNPMEVWPANCLKNTSRQHVEATRQPWFGCACCPPNIARTLAGLGQYIYSLYPQDHLVMLQQYISHEAKLSWADPASPTAATGDINLRLTGNYCRDGRLTLTVQHEAAFTLALRRPGWAQSFILTDRQGHQLTGREHKGFVYLDLAPGQQQIQLSIRVEPTWVQASPAVRADRGLIALTRGPLVYCLEACDNGPDLWALLADTSQLPVAVEAKELGGYTQLQARGWRETWPDWDERQLYAPLRPPVQQPLLLRFVPYAYWGNRKLGEMKVWVRRG
ncbi:MAG: glycoside hydrolase family 127 protein [Oscillospiraceae bacterium]|nr:glycoside hydrolase family 127 protein [Oscillospiraceae bacterium]MDD4367424.1 glycoside hydrolase family 127 protein [Oscillospiraceae bacterium]